MRKFIQFLIAGILLVVAITGCNFPVSTQIVETPVLNSTVILQTLQSQATPSIEPATTVPQATATDNPTSTVSPSPSVTLTPTIAVPMISATLNTNCRTGPGRAYKVVGYLLKDKDPVEVVGRYEPGTWWVIKNPDNPSEVCWVWTDTTGVQGDVSQLPLATAPPSPTPTNTPTVTQTPTVTETP